MERDPCFEDRLLEQLQAPREFLQQVRGRLRATEDVKGNDGWERPVDELLAEILEEAADVCGWAVGAAYQLGDPERQRLLVCMRLGVAAWRETRELLDLVIARG
jgi:hypothetical protein